MVLANECISEIEHGSGIVDPQWGLELELDMYGVVGMDRDADDGEGVLAIDEGNDTIDEGHEAIDKGCNNVDKEDFLVDTILSPLVTSP